MAMQNQMYKNTSKRHGWYLTPSHWWLPLIAWTADETGAKKTKCRHPLLLAQPVAKVFFPESLEQTQ